MTQRETYHRSWTEENLASRARRQAEDKQEELDSTRQRRETSDKHTYQNMERVRHQSSRASQPQGETRSEKGKTHIQPTPRPKSWLQRQNTHLASMLQRLADFDRDRSFPAVKVMSGSLQEQSDGQGRESERDRVVTKRKWAFEREREASCRRYAPPRAVRAGANLIFLIVAERELKRWERVRIFFVVGWFVSQTWSFQRFCLFLLFFSKMLRLFLYSNERESVIFL